MDPQFRPSCARRLAGIPRERDRGTIVGSESEVRIVTGTDVATKPRKHDTHEKHQGGFFAFSCFRVFRGLSLVGAAIVVSASPASAATKAIRAGRLVDPSAKVT